MRTKKIVLSGLFLALGLLMPFITGQIPDVGNMLLPMHLPIMICGYVCGGSCGFVVGFITPLLRSVLFGMPPMVPKAICMAFELAAYGVVSGWMYQTLQHKKGRIYISLLVSMVVGRVIWGITATIVYKLVGISFGLEIFFAEAVVNALPGMGLQLVLVPLLIFSLERAGFLEK